MSPCPSFCFELVTCRATRQIIDLFIKHLSLKLGLIAYVRGCSQTPEGSLECLGRPSEDLNTTLWHTSTWTWSETWAAAEAFSSMLTECHTEVKLQESLQISKESTNEAELPIPQSITNWIKTKVIKKLSQKHGYSSRKKFWKHA